MPKPLVLAILLLLLAAVAAGYWWLQSQPTPMDMDLPTQRDVLSGSSPDLVSKTSTTTSRAPDEEPVATTKPQAKATVGSKPRYVGAPELPMTEDQRREVAEHWERTYKEALSDEDFLLLSRTHAESFGELVEADKDAQTILEGLRGLVGYRIGIGDPDGRASVALGYLPQADHALRSMPSAIREGHVRFRLLHNSDESKDGPLTAPPHNERLLHYRYRVGDRIVEVDIDRRATAGEVLDHFDPQRRTYR